MSATRKKWRCRLCHSWIDADLDGCLRCEEKISGVKQPPPPPKPAAPPKPAVPPNTRPPPKEAPPKTMPQEPIQDSTGTPTVNVLPTKVGAAPAVEPGFYTRLARNMAKAEARKPTRPAVDPDEVEISDDDDDVHFVSCRQEATKSIHESHGSLRDSGKLVVSDDDEEGPGISFGTDTAASSEETLSAQGSYGPLSGLSSWSEQQLSSAMPSGADNFFSCNLDSTLLSAAYNSSSAVNTQAPPSNFYEQHVAQGPASQACISISNDSRPRSQSNYLAPSLVDALSNATISGTTPLADGVSPTVVWNT